MEEALINQRWRGLVQYLTKKLMALYAIMHPCWNNIWPGNFAEAGCRITCRIQIQLQSI